MLLAFLWLALPARANNPLLDANQRPNVWFWATGGALMAADKPLYQLAGRLDAPATHATAVALNNLGDGRVQLGSFAVFALVGGVREKTIARHGLHGLVAAGLAVALLKNTTDKARPYAGRGPVYFVRPAPATARAEPEANGLAEPGSVSVGDRASHADANRSFPSGHTAAAFSLATVWAQERPRDRELVYTLAALVGMARIQLKQHWPSDVFFGAAIGIAAGSAANRGVPFGLMFRVR